MLRGKGNRRILQAATSISTMKNSMFQVDTNGAGGCIFILAPTHSVSLYGVSFVDCSSVYGGGGFFNVSLFEANQVTAQGNVARQGGGMFVAATRRTIVEFVNFFNNTVVTSVGSNRRTYFRTAG